jgi:hypothetical protein
MRYLKVGVKGLDVLAWKTFLRGVLSRCQLIVNDVFDEDTKKETIRFQTKAGLKGTDADGVVGNLTLGLAASKFGFPLAIDDGDDVGPNWPHKPDDVVQFAYADREKVFGHFSYVAVPTPTNAEAIRITDDWATKNIVIVDVPQLIGVTGASSSGHVSFNAKAAKQLQALFVAWEAAGLKDHIISWGGGWVPRFIRGSQTVLSNHSWGTAFDINVPWNMLGTVPALKGKKGSVRELVEIAVQHGFFWGGWFSTRADGMHFEIFKIMP